MTSTKRSISATGDVTATNRSFYDGLWSQSKLSQPERFNTWPLIERLVAEAPNRLEIGPGLRPRLPISGTHFLDLSPPVIERLNANGGVARVGHATQLPFETRSLDLVCAFDIIEHVEDDLAVFAELSRVTRENGVLIFSVPLYGKFWNAFDQFVGHVRRYEPDELAQLLRKYGFVAEKSAIFGMQPANTKLLELGMWFLTHQRERALFWYNLFLPLCIRFQKPLNFSPGLIDKPDVAEIVLVCRRGGDPG